MSPFGNTCYATIDNVSGVGTLGVTLNAHGIADLAGNTNVAAVVSSTVVVVGVAVNAGQANQAQRSLITNVTVTFPSIVTLGANAFSFTGTSPSGGALNLGPASIAVSTQVVNGMTVATLTFLNDGSNGHNTEGGNGVFSLGDGAWDLHILASQVSGGGFSSNYDSIASGVTINRLYGDVNGIGQVDPSSFNAFSAAYLSTTGAANFVSAFDVFNIGQIDPTTFNRFAQNYGLSV